MLLDLFTTVGTFLSKMLHKFIDQSSLLFTETHYVHYLQEIASLVQLIHTVPYLSFAFQIAHGCDPNWWKEFEDGSAVSLLHRAIELQDHPTACFLIESGADVNSFTRPSGMSKELASAPLHMACQRGLKEIVTSLVNHHANVNSKVG